MQSRKMGRSFQVRDYGRHVGRREGASRTPETPICSPLCVLSTQRYPAAGRLSTAHCWAAAIIPSNRDSASSNYTVYCFIIHPTLPAPATTLLASTFHWQAYPPSSHTLQSHPVLSHLSIPLVSVNNMLHFNYTFRNSILNS